jgi:NAD(P)-dependent dehydrogenase (short-subunit alcohol dehydrogenase family)
METFSLKDKKALVSGASRGLGREIAFTLAEAGADVVLAARNQEGLKETAARIQAMGRKALICSMDITKLDEIDKTVNEAIKAFGRIDILVNNSGVPGEGAVVDLTPEKWDGTVAVNLRGHVFCTKAVGQHMIKNRYGKIINIASVLGILGTPYLSAYSATKAGLISFTKTVALEWVRYNIQVNALCPGYFMTDMNREFLQSPTGQKVINKIPMRRVGEAKELRGPLLLLASDASSFMTGSTLIVDGGHSVE